MNFDRLRRLTTPGKVRKAIKELKGELKTYKAPSNEDTDDDLLDEIAESDIQGEILLLENMLTRMEGK